MNRQYPLPLPHKEAMEADDFMVTESNAEAVTRLNAWPAWPSHCLILSGPSGSGKTHLASLWKTRSAASLLDVSGISVQNEKHTGAVFAIENANQVAGDGPKEEALFHLFNRTRDEKGFLLLTSDRPPAFWNVTLPDLRSRLVATPLVSLGAADDALLSALLIKQFRDRQVDIGADLVDYVLPRLERTPAAIRAFVTRIDSLSLAERRPLTVALARKTLEDQDFLI